MARRVIVRMAAHDFAALRDHLCQDPSQEQFCFGLGTRFSRRRTTVLLVNELVFPDQDDLETQSCGMVGPTRAYQNYVYREAKRRGLSIIDIHTHTHLGQPHFSGIDTAEAAKTAAYIGRRMPLAVTMAMLVFGSDCRHYSGLLYDRLHQRFRPVRTIEILGNRVEFLDHTTTEIPHDQRFSRHELIPGWNQDRMERLQVAVVGLGGNGAWVAQLLAGLGVGRRGWLYFVDLDCVEESNLPRIPYATTRDLGLAKVDVAADYVRARDPRIHVLTSREPVQSKSVMERLRFAHVLIGCVDSHGPRKILNDLSIRYGIPFIDLGCEIFLDGQSSQAVAQSRVVIPGVTGCLMCCELIDPVQAAHDLLTDQEKTEFRRHGYIHGQQGTPAPSVATLNALTASLGSSVLTQLVSGGLSAGRELLSIEQASCSVLTAGVPRSETCPVCGEHGVLGQGDVKDFVLGNRDLGKARVLGVGAAQTCDSVTENSDGSAKS